MKMLVSIRYLVTLVLVVHKHVQSLKNKQQNILHWHKSFKKVTVHSNLNTISIFSGES